MSVVRGCGTRHKGGIYAESELSPFGVPIEECLFDPPVPADLAELGVTPRGVTLIERDGVTHIVDYVGEESYPNVMDFVEEVRRFGLSRRLPKNLDFSRIGPASRILLIHKKAWIENSAEYFAARPQMAAWPCPKRLDEHKYPAAAPAMCASLWREDLEGDDLEIPSALHEIASDDPRWIWEEGYGDRGRVKVMPSFRYVGAVRPEGVNPAYRPAFFLGLPLTRITIINDPEGDSHEDALLAAKKANLPVGLEDE